MVEIDHERIDDYMEPMTMPFKVADTSLYRQIVIGGVVPEVLGAQNRGYSKPPHGMKVKIVPAAANHPDQLIAEIARVEGQIDRIPHLEQLIAAGRPRERGIPSQLAFQVWSRTSLAEKLYGAIQAYASGTLTATPGSSIIGLFGATLPANGSCTVSVNVTGKTAGKKVNTTAATSIESGPGSPASASITVRKSILPVTGSRISIYAAIALTTLGLGGVLIVMSHRLARRRRQTA